MSQLDFADQPAQKKKPIGLPVDPLVLANSPLPTRKEEKKGARPALDPLAIYPRKDGARTVGVSEITLIRAYDNGHLKAFRVGRRVLHSGQHLLDWLAAGGKTSVQPKRGGAR
jgi:hypothetical protein